MSIYQKDIVKKSSFKLTIISQQELMLWAIVEAPTTPVRFAHSRSRLRRRERDSNQAGSHAMVDDCTQFAMYDIHRKRPHRFPAICRNRNLGTKRQHATI